MHFFSFQLIFNVLAIGQEDRLEDSKGAIYLDSELTYKMMEQVHDFRKMELFVNERKNLQVEKPGLIFGASLIAIADYQKSNTDSKFAYLMRHPTASNEIGETVSEAVLHSFQLSFTANVNSWLSAYSEFLYNPEQSFGAGTITALGRNLVQLRRGFIVVGDLNKLPFYISIGKMDGNFGLSGSVNAFSNSTMYHAFGTLAYGAMIGYSKNGLNASLMLIQGGAQFRAANAPVDNTSVPSRLNNFAVDANYTLLLGNTSRIKVGGSYQKASAYCQGFPVQHFMPCEESNPAYTFYGTLNLGQLKLMGAFAKTTDTWPGTENPNPPLNEFEAAKVSSLNLGANYMILKKESFDLTVSGEFSNFVSGADNSPWERQNQIVLGLAGQFNHSSKLFIELFHTQGYAPLNFISGGNLPDPGTTHSDRDARSIGILLGGMISL